MCSRSAVSVLESRLGQSKGFFVNPSFRSNNVHSLTDFVSFRFVYIARLSPDLHEKQELESYYEDLFARLKVWIKLCQPSINQLTTQEILTLKRRGASDQKKYIISIFFAANTSRRRSCRNPSDLSKLHRPFD